jgi:hypothetical protein
MVQWVQHGLDHDIACGVGVSGTRPVVQGAAEVGGRLAVAPGTWGPDGIGISYVWTRDGVPIPGAISPSYEPTTADVGAQVAVSVTGSRLGAPSLTLTSAPVAVVDPNAEQLTMNAFPAQRFGS